MKYKLLFQLQQPLELPIQYNHILQAALINWIKNPLYQQFLHNEGYKKEKRKYKLYSFSKIYGKYLIKKEEKIITFFDKIHIYLSCCDTKYIEYLTQNILTGYPLILGRYQLMISEIETIRELYKQTCIVKTLSPVSIYSTLVDSTGRKKTYYYNPHEKEFSHLAKNNLINKYISFYGKEPNNKELIIELIKGEKESIIHYKGYIIKGWNGVFSLTGSEELIEIALNAGLGGRNSIGLGCIIAI